MTRGGKNLALLGLASILVAAVTTGISLAIYHNSGDIYLDRSRPGYLPDEEEIEEENGKKEEEYSFSGYGKIKIEDINEYIEKLKIEIDAIDSYKNPFGEDGLSDKKMGIPEGT